MKKIITVLTLLIILLITEVTFSISLLAEEKKKKEEENQKVISQILKGYKKEGGKNFNAKKGSQMWAKTFIVRNKKKKCAACHHIDITKSGTHNRSGKYIDPMAAWTQPSRYTDVKKVEKWFKQNCKATWGRECTPQEKGDFLMFLRAPLKKTSKK